MEIIQINEENQTAIIKQGMNITTIPLSELPREEKPDKTQKQTKQKKTKKQAKKQDKED